MKYTIGIDIGATNTEMGLVNFKGLIVYRTSFKTNQFYGLNGFLEILVENIKLLYHKVKKQEDIVAIGIGAPNGNAVKGTIEHAPNLKFKGIIYLKKRLSKMLEQRGYTPKIYLTNDANAAAIGEMLYGKAKKGIKDFIMITLGTGVGSGIVSNGKLVYGYSSFAGEIGHTKVCDNGRQCNCGKKDCLETYSSATGIVTTAKELLSQSVIPSLLRELPDNKLESKDIYEAAIKGDVISLQCFDLTAKMLAIALANASAVTSPQKIYIFGGLAQSGDLLLKPLKKYFEEELYVTFKRTIDIELSGLKGSDAAILGSAALGFSNEDR
jgi:glucokinase